MWKYHFVNAQHCRSSSWMMNKCQRYGCLHCQEQPEPRWNGGERGDCSAIPSQFWIGSHINPFVIHHWYRVISEAILCYWTTIKYTFSLFCALFDLCMIETLKMLLSNISQLNWSKLQSSDDTFALRNGIKQNCCALHLIHLVPNRTELHFIQTSFRICKLLKRCGPCFSTRRNQNILHVCFNRVISLF